MHIRRLRNDNKRLRLLYHKGGYDNGAKEKRKEGDASQ